MEVAVAAETAGFGVLSFFSAAERVRIFSRRFCSRISLRICFWNRDLAALVPPGLEVDFILAFLVPFDFARYFDAVRPDFFSHLVEIVSSALVVVSLLGRIART
jgi:hypothetical protein